MGRGGLLREFPEGNGRGGGDVERVDAVGHGDAHDVVGRGDGFGGQAVALGAEDNGEAGLGAEAGMADGDAALGEGHGGGAEAEGAEAVEAGVDPGPGNEEDGTHRHAHGAAVEGVAGGGREEDRVDAEGGGGTEDGADVGGVDHAVDDGDATGTAADALDGGGLGTAHGAEHAAREGVARERGEQLAAAGVDGGQRTAGEDVGGVAREVAALAEEGEGFEAGVEGDADDLGALGNEDALLGS